MSKKLVPAITVALAAFLVVLMGALGAYVLQGGTRARVGAQLPASGLAAPGGIAGGQAAQTPIAGRAPDVSDSGALSITPDQAAQIAQQSVPGASVIGDTALVNMGGTPAYRVLLSSGPVYVDANSGQVLGNVPGQRLRRRGR